MEKKHWEEETITGASFTLAPMSDDFVNVIKDALKKTDTSNVWMETDDVTTTAKGEMSHVFDVIGTILIHAARTGKHVAFQATYSAGCPGDVSGESYIANNDNRLNLADKEENNQYAAAKFSLYPLGGGNYMDTIYNQIEAMKDYVTVTPAYNSTRLEGGIADIFYGLENAFRKTIDSGSRHTVMTVSISVNSPSHKKET